jgi:hypothetical protein
LISIIKWMVESTASISSVVENPKDMAMMEAARHRQTTVKIWCAYWWKSGSRVSLLHGHDGLTFWGCRDGGQGRGTFQECSPRRKPKLLYSLLNGEG